MPSSPQEPARQRAPRIYLECYETATTVLKTGIQRVVRNLILNHEAAAQEVSVEAQPARFIGDAFYPFEWQPKNDVHRSGWGENLQRRLTGSLRKWIGDRWTTRLSILGARAQKAVRFRKLRRLIKTFWLKHFGQRIRPEPNDLLVLIDVTWGLNVWPATRQWRAEGGKVAFLVYDILPITHSQFVCESLSRRFAAWFELVLDHSDLILTISETVRDQLREIIRNRAYPPGATRPQVEAFPLGAELDMRHANAYVRPALRHVLTPTNGPAPYLMVGTIEPRKNHQTALDAFDLLWERGHDVRLCIIGRRGWQCHEIERRIWNHPRFGRQLFWFPDLSDSELQRCYEGARGVVFASRGEGFGLPIVEGLQFGKTVIASNLPVHQEVAGQHAAYFDPDRPEELAALVEKFESLGYLPGILPPQEFRATTWLEGTTELIARCRDAMLADQTGETTMRAVGSHEATREVRRLKCEV